MTIGSGNDQIDFCTSAAATPNGDAWVVFPALRVMHAGDIFSGKNIPLLDAINGGSGIEMAETLAKAADSRPRTSTDHHRHSTVMTVADLREYRPSIGIS